MAKTHTVAPGAISATAATAAPQPKKDATPTLVNVATFDPIDFVRNYVTNDDAKREVLSSMSWYIDATLTNSVRTLFFRLFDDLKVSGDIDNYNEFLARMDEDDARQKALVEQGMMETLNVSTIRQLSLMRVTWHDAVYELNPRHTCKPIAELIRSEKVQLPDALSKAKLRTVAEMLCEGEDEPAIEAMYQELLTREEIQAKNRFETARNRMDALIGMYEFIDNTSTLAEVSFEELPVATRRTLLENTKRALSQAMMRMTTNRKISVLEFGAALKELKHADKLIAEVLSSKVYDEEAIVVPAADAGEAGRDWNGASEEKSARRRQMAAKAAQAH